MAVDGRPGRAGGVVVALVNKAEVIGAVADDRAVARVQRVHPLDLAAGDAGVPEGDAARCAEARAGEASERVESEGVDGAAEKVGDEYGGSGEEEGEEERVVAGREESAGLGKQAWHSQMGCSCGPRHDDVKTKGVRLGEKVDDVDGRGEQTSEGQMAASMKQAATLSSSHRPHLPPGQQTQTRAIRWAKTSLTVPR